MIALMADEPISLFGNNSGREANEVDLALGRRVRTFRLRANLSQTELAGKLGLTFQQIQKYEKGVNRIAASRLVDIANALDAPLSAFFDFSAETGTSCADPGKIYDLLSTPDGQRLVAAFSAITTPNLRRRVLRLVEAMVETDKA